MAHYYAQINAQGIVYAITQTSGKIINPTMIEVDGLHESLLGMKYENGQFVSVEE